MLCLLSLNASFTHTSLALRYLRECAVSVSGVACSVLEFNINQPYTAVFDELSLAIAAASEGPAHPSGAGVILGFAVYIWNRTEVLQLARSLKRAYPDLVVALGGPEVAYGPLRALSEAPEVDCILVGEGELTLPALLTAYSRHAATNPRASALHEALRLWPVPGIITKVSGRAVEALHPRLQPAGETNVGAALPPVHPFLPDLAELPWAYRDPAPSVAGRIAYYESSRGCPFSCAYCLSAAQPGVRYVPLDRVKADLSELSGLGPRQIKFVDRTFNSDASRAREIWRYLIEAQARRARREALPKRMQPHALEPSPRPAPADVAAEYHFELGGSLIGDDDLLLLQSAPPGLFQFEIGVQSVSPEVRSGVSRHDSLDALALRVSRLVAEGRVRVNLDLIAGMPGETLESFMCSVDWCFALAPNCIHAGVLKILEGTPLSCDADRYGLIHSPDPPYEVLRTPTMPPEAITACRQLSAMLDVYHNGGRFVHTIALLRGCLPSASGFLVEVAECWRRDGASGKGVGLSAARQLLLEACSSAAPEHLEAMRETSRLDMLLCGLPTEGSRPATSRERAEALADAGLGPSGGSLRVVMCDLGQGATRYGRTCLALVYGPVSEGRSPCAVVPTPLAARGGTPPSC